MTENDRKVFSHLLDYVKGKHPLKLSSRSCILCGDPGLGKTFLAERFLEEIGLPIHYLGFSELKLKNVSRHKDIHELDKAVNDDNCVIFIDDLNTVLDLNDFERGMTQECKRSFMSILDKIKKSRKNMLFLSTVNNYAMIDDPILDRIECKIHFSDPSLENKKEFLRQNYGDVLSKTDMSLISRLSIGYNFRDLPEVVKLSFRLGNGRITKKSIEESLAEYNPNNMMNNVQRIVKSDFKKVFGKEGIKKELSRVMHLSKAPIQRSRLFHTSKCIIFSGPPGTGKTLMARSFAGENTLPLITMRPEMFCEMGPASTLKHAFRMAKENDNCVIFVDEADKLFGMHNEMDSENALHAIINSNVEGTSDKPLKSIIIFAVNRLGRLGDSLKDRFKVIEFDLPDDGERGQYINNMIGTDISAEAIETLTKTTAGMNFREMRQVCERIIMDKAQGMSITPEYIQRNAAKMMKETEHVSRSIYG